MSTQSPHASREAQASVATQFIERWSPRSFSSKAVTEDDIRSVLEAARWSHSCFNAQPWYFAVEARPAQRENVLSLLVEGNRTWAEKAPVLGVLFCRKNFEHNGKPNRWAGFDAGSAAMAMSLQARELELFVHWMGGFDATAALAHWKLDGEEFEAMAAFALGHQGEASALPEGLREKEVPSDRKNLNEIAQIGVPS